MPMYLEDFKVGQTYTSPARTITEADVVAFAGLSGDYNPIHTDVEFAANSQFKQRIAHGMLGLSILTGLGSRSGILDGSAIAFLGIEEWKFAAPVFFGDTVHVRMTVVDVRPSSKPGAGVLKRKMELVNQKDQVVQSGTFVTMVRAKP